MATGLETNEPDRPSGTDVGQITSDLVQKHGGGAEPIQPKVKRKYTRRGQTLVPTETVPPAPSLSPADVEASKVLVRKTAESVIDAVDSAIVRNAVGKAERAGCPKESLGEVRSNIALSGGERDVMAECVSNIVARHEFLLRWAPETMLACVILSWSARVLTVNRQLDTLIEKAKRREPSAQVE